MNKSFFLYKTKKTTYSFEYIPSFVEYNMYDILNKLYSTIEFNPIFINITSHLYKKLQNKLKKIGTVSVCVAIIHKYEINVIPHFLCETTIFPIAEDFLIKLNFLGIYKILIIRGDFKKINKEKNIYNYSIELIKQIEMFKMVKNFEYKFNICIGTAVYPEKHFESPNIEEDIYRLYQKIKAGSHYLITQMFFDNNKYFCFIEKIHFAGLNLPIIPGIKPFSSKNQLKAIPLNFYVEIPVSLIKRIKKYNKDIFYIGIEWAIKQSIELKETGVPVIHYYTSNKSDNIYQIIIELIALNIKI